MTKKIRWLAGGLGLVGSHVKLCNKEQAYS